MRFALATMMLASLAVPPSAVAQSDEPYRVVDPFTVAPQGGVSASISDDAEPPEREGGFSFPKLSMPKLPELSMPKWKLPKLPKPQMPSFSRSESSASRSRQTTRTSTSRNSTGRSTTTRSTANRNPPPAGPSAWEKFNSGTKTFFAKTKSTLMPWTADNDQDASPRPPTGSNRTRVASSSSRSRPEEKKPSIFSPFSRDKEPEERQVESTTDFLKLPRP